MERRNVQLHLGGQSYRVVTTATDTELKRCVAALEERLNDVNPKGRAPHNQALFLAMLSLVNELDEARAAAARTEAHARETLSTLLHRIDAALDEGPSAGDAGARHEEARALDGPASEEASPT